MISVRIKKSIVILLKPITKIIPILSILTRVFCQTLWIWMIWDLSEEEEREECEEVSEECQVWVDLEWEEALEVWEVLVRADLEGIFLEITKASVIMAHSQVKVYLGWAKNKRKMMM
jgi:hypothetical protein